MMHYASHKAFSNCKSGCLGVPLKKKVPMGNGKFADGSSQSLYYPEGHERAGVFKGMGVILEERGYEGALKIRAECPKFQCKKGATCCCCRRMLYNEPDFVSVKSLLEVACEARGFRAIFFPKFHCELNFIEQCWGYSKRIYRELPASSKEVDLERNVLQSLDSVPLLAIRRFSARSLRFMDAYRKGLNGKQAAWASKKYRGHRVLPETIMRDLTDAGLSHDLYVTTFVLNPAYRNAPIYKQVSPMAGPTLTITKSVTGVITCATKPPQDMVTHAALALQRILQREYGDSYEAGNLKYPDPVVEMKLRNPMLAEFSPTDTLVSFRTQFKAYIKDEDPFNQKMRTNESALGWWKALQKDELANVLAKLKTPYKPLVKWRDMEFTILGKRPAEDLPPASRMPPPPEARTVDSDLDSENEFDDGADWLDAPAALSEFKRAEKDSFVLAASSGIDLRAPYLHELLDSIGKQPLHPGSAPTKKAAAKNLSSSVPDPSAWDEWK
ncbi:hypothetical protein F4604DRAFT_1952032 [Suillus subluteus]|nr:hypothetical protein F4604DRAFT_1952032 [Suillus subluteus]